MTLPNFLILGAAKSGTTALYRYLSEHPDIYLSSYKEPRFLLYEGADPNQFKGPGDSDRVREAIRNLKDYEKLFDNVSHETAIGEASPIYLYHHDICIPKIKTYIPDSQFIILLRHPVDRAFSMFLHHFRGGFYRDAAKTGMAGIEAKFIELFDTEDSRIQNNWTCWWHYKTLGFYSSQVSAYLNNFGNDKVKIYLSDDLKNNTAATVQDAFQFLGVDDSFQPNLDRKHNKFVKINKIPKNQVLHNLIIQSNPLKTIIKPLIPEKIRRKLSRQVMDKNMTQTQETLSFKLSPETRNQLTEIYRDDILKLQDILNRDLSHWLPS
jgi:hypothetical protein